MDWLIDWLFEFFDWFELTDWLIDWLAFFRTDCIAQFMSVSVTCYWKTGIPLAFVNSFSSIQVTWLQKAVKARLKIKHVIKHLINLHCIENIIVVLVYVLEFPLNEKKKKFIKVASICPWNGKDYSIFLSSGQDVVQPVVILFRPLMEPVEAKNVFTHVQQKFTLISTIYVTFQTVEIVFHPREQLKLFYTPRGILGDIKGQRREVN